jgi:hypothetical protein
MVPASRLIYLDVDEVLVMDADYTRVFPESKLVSGVTGGNCINLLNNERLPRVARVAVQANAGIIISSDWRKTDPRRSAIISALNRAIRALEGFGAPTRVLGVTPGPRRLGWTHRGEEIADHVQTTPEGTRYVILDDLAEARAGVIRDTGLFIQTHEPDGFREEDAAAALAWLTQATPIIQAPTT